MIQFLAILNHVLPIDSISHGVFRIWDLVFGSLDTLFGNLNGVFGCYSLLGVTVALAEGSMPQSFSLYVICI